MTAVITAPAPAGARPAGPPSPRGTWGGILTILVTTLVLTPVSVAVGGRMTLLAVAALVLVTVSYVHPPAAAYVVLVATPLTAGFSRSAFIPLLRPHEALAMVAGTGVALRALAQLWTEHRLPLRFGRLDAVIVAMAGTSSLLPLLWMVARGIPPNRDDLLYAGTIWKFYALFLLVRASVRTERQVRRCLYLSIAAAAVMTVVAILQSMQIAGVPALVTAVYPIEGGGVATPGRGSSTLGSPIAVGDVVAVSLAICLALLLCGQGRRTPLLVLAGLFTIGGIATGQFSGVIAIGIAVFVVAVVARRVKRLLIACVPVALAGLVVLRPVVQDRLAAVDSSTGLPHSWWVRLENLRLYVWPEVFSGQNWLFGVRPLPVLRVDAPWASQIYIESGHTWLLWTGGVPFLLAYLIFIWVAARTVAVAARSRRDSVGAAATAALASLSVVFVLMTFDPHLTMRGGADLLFSLLALATAVPRQRRDAQGEAAHTPDGRLPCSSTIAFGADHVRSP
jgi:hypothetical protein